MARRHLGAWLLVSCAAATTLDPERFHCVAHVDGGGFLMRSNMPLRANATGVAAAEQFAYDDVMRLARARARDECGAALADDAYLVEVSLADAFDDANGLLAARAWHADPAHFARGRLAEWPLGVAGLVPAARVDAAARAGVAERMFVVDQLPQRVAMLDALLAAAPPAGAAVVVLVHCNAGCDRTGEMIGSWRLASGAATSAAEMYALDVAECGRAPNYYSTHALEWYCLRLQAEGREGLGDCLGFATCEPFGDCVPTNDAAVRAPGGAASGGHGGGAYDPH